ncbi:BQ5605_C030g10819 [Microbotryum silenes-dioicae]|uniref:BQ5605_C030g10819 protein n=1 Tax=Microbotryum silenes-dioicae TaxID=796604 RepID=A0A2X0MI65_9BASI|nr:BQ5605_C030g10819 [Microbotryum silenes-dioicae]
MRFLPILLVAAVVGIQASSVGLCPNLDKRCDQGYNSTDACIEGRYGLYVGDVPGSVCDWAQNATTCWNKCLTLKVHWCTDQNMQPEDMGNQTLCCENECCAKRNP